MYNKQYFYYIFLSKTFKYIHFFYFACLYRNFFLIFISIFFGFKLYFLVINLKKTCPKKKYKSSYEDLYNYFLLIIPSIVVIAVPTATNTPPITASILTTSLTIRFFSIIYTSIYHRY